MWESIIEKNDIQECWRWFRKGETSDVITTKKLVQAMEMDCQVIQQNGKAVAEMQNFLWAKAVQWKLGNPLSNV